MLYRISAGIWILLFIPALLWWPSSLAFVIIAGASIWASVTSSWLAAEVTSKRELLQRLARIEEELHMINNSRSRRP